MKLEEINKAILALKNNQVNSVSDGSHTFSELYHHRAVLFSIICKVFKDNAWKSKLHDDGTMYDNYFIVGVTTEAGDYSYHYHMSYWEYFSVKELDKAPKWDGHTPSDINILYSLLWKEDSEQQSTCKECGSLMSDCVKVWKDQRKCFPDCKCSDDSAFSVGKYYVAKYAGETKIYRVEHYNVPEGRSISAKIFDLETKGFVNVNWDIKQMKDDELATAGQIAIFIRAEHFAAKGRKLDEIKPGDLIDFEGQKNIVGQVDYYDNLIDIKVCVRGGSFTHGNIGTDFKLLLTSEELKALELI